MMFLGQTFVHLPHNIHSGSLFIFGISIPIGQICEQALQCIHSSFSTEICNKLILLNGANNAPIGQKYLHQPLSIIKIKIMKRMKIIKAIQKKGLGTNFPGYKNNVGMVPVKNPIGQISVNINEINAVVRNTSITNTKYLQYLK